MKKIFLLVFAFALMGANYCFAQIARTANIVVETFPMNPQSGGTNYFGVRVTLPQTYDQNVTVTGTIYENGNPSVNTPFTVTVTTGNVTNETSSNHFGCNPTSDASITTATISPAIVTNSGLSYSTQFLISGSRYDFFDAKFKNIGALHNSLLVATANGSPLHPSDTSYEANVTSVMNFLKSAFSSSYESYFDTTYSSGWIDDEFLSAKYNGVPWSFIASTQNSTDTRSFDSCVIKANALGYLNGDNKALYESIVAAVDSAAKSLLSNEYFEESMARLANEWLVINSGNETSMSAMFTGSIITLSLKSCEWWRENPEAMEEVIYSFNYNPNNSGDYFSSMTLDRQTALAMDISESNAQVGELRANAEQLQHAYESKKAMFVLPWVYADAAGAVVGMAVAGIKMGINNRFSANDLLIGTVASAIIASSGIVGKLTGWFRKYF